MRISDWSSDVCSSDLVDVRSPRRHIVDGTVGAAAQEGREMQSQSKILDDMAKLASSALGVAAGMRSEVEASFREQIERLLTKMDLVPRAACDDMARAAPAAREGRATRPERKAGG